MENVKKMVQRCLLMALFSVVPLLVTGQATPTNEYQVKAAFLFNFTMFIDWPAHSFVSGDAPFVIGVLGQDPFGDYLEQIIEGEKIQGHPLVVKRFHALEDAKNSHLLFLNPGKGDKLSELLTSLKNTNILTVGDVSGFTSHGGMIGFVTENRKVRIQINLQAAQLADLTVSSKLLRVAEIVSVEN